MNHADFADEERNPLYIFLGAAVTKRSTNLGQLQIRMK